MSVENKPEPRGFRDVMSSQTREGFFRKADRTWGQFYKEVAEIGSGFDLKTKEGAKKALESFVESCVTSGSLDDFKEKRFEMRSSHVRSGLLGNFKEAERLVSHEFKKEIPVFKEIKEIAEETRSWDKEKAPADKKQKIEALKKHIAAAQGHLHDVISRRGAEAKVNHFSEIEKKDFVSEKNVEYICSKLMTGGGKVEDSIDEWVDMAVQSFFSSEKTEANAVLNKSMGIGAFPSLAEKPAAKPKEIITESEVKEVVEDTLPQAPSSSVKTYQEVMQDKFHEMCEFFRVTFNYLFAGVSRALSIEHGNDLAEVFSQKIKFLEDLFEGKKPAELENKPAKPKKGSLYGYVKRGFKPKSEKAKESNPANPSGEVKKAKYFDWPSFPSVKKKQQ